MKTQKELETEYTRQKESGEYCKNLKIKYAILQGKNYINTVSVMINESTGERIYYENREIF